MSATTYRFTFDDSVPFAEAELTLQLAVIAVEGLFGAARVKLDFDFRLDPQAAAIVINARTDVGTAVVEVFTSLALREFGEHGVRVRRVADLPNRDGGAA
jgi:hypothetical protein